MWKYSSIFSSIASAIAAISAIWVSKELFLTFSDHLAEVSAIGLIAAAGIAYVGFRAIASERAFTKEHNANSFWKGNRQV